MIYLDKRRAKRGSFNVYHSKFGQILKYKTTQIMDDLSKPECVIYGEYRDSNMNFLVLRMR